MKKIYIGRLTEIFLAILNKQQVFIIKKDLKKIQYINIPNNIKIKKENDFLFFYEENEKLNSLSSFFPKLFSLVTINNIIKKKLILKGIGYKMSLSADSKDIIFKLGYSHLIILPIPEQIFNVCITKNLISIQSYSVVFLGNFLAKIRNFRIPDSYKGKGFIRKNENLLLKQLKKK